MDAPVTLRLDKETRERVARLARRNQMSASEVIREAIDSWLKTHEVTANPYEAAVDLVGVVHGGKWNRSMNTGVQFGELLKRKRTRA